MSFLSAFWNPSTCLDMASTGPQHCSHVRTDGSPKSREGLAASREESLAEGQCIQLTNIHLHMESCSYGRFARVKGRIRQGLVEPLEQRRREHSQKAGWPNIREYPRPGVL